MEIIDCIQGSSEWFELRKQRMSASHAQAIAANGKGLTTYINQLMGNYYSTDDPETYQSKAMLRGIELESSARFAYEMETGNEVQEVGFIIHDEYSGASPDGLVGDNGLVEIKALENKAYFQYLLDEKIDTGYLWQVQAQMLICERDWSDYVLYNPNYKRSLIIQRVFKDEAKFAKLETGLAAGRMKIKAIKEKMDGVL